MPRSKTPLGRPRGFDPDLALDRALMVFWRKGYEGTSLSDLTRAMRINRPSLYSAFGNKQSLFCKALDRYAEGPAGYVRNALLEPKARRVVERLLSGAIDLVTNPRHPGGCLAVHGALACGTKTDPVRRELVSRREARREALRKRLSRAKSEGDLPPSADPAQLARYVMTVIQGMSVQAASGATRRELRSVAAAALRAWPKA